MPSSLTRILSDVHYGDHASRVKSLAQLRPLLDGLDTLVLNGDTLDTRDGPAPAFTAACRAETLAFFPAHAPAVTFLTGNHDPDLTPHHTLDLAGGQVFVTHGDILFDDIVPWSRDVPLITRLLAAELAALPPAARHDFDARLAAYRRVAAAIPQRHQAERNVFKYAYRFARDTVWPPSRVLRILRAWRETPALAAQFVRTHRPRAKFIINGHTHRPGVWRMDDVTVINTGAYCPPHGRYAVDVSPGKLSVRDVVSRGGEFRFGATLAEFALAAS